MTSYISVLLATGALGLVLCSCARTSESGPAPIMWIEAPGAQPTGAYANTNTCFTNAVLWKPAERSAAALTNAEPGSATHSLIWTLAPLFMMEVRSTNNTENTEPAPELWQLQEVGASAAVKSFGNQSRAQITYEWLLARSSATQEAKRQSVRITLDGGGYPVIWEVLNGSAKNRAVFIAESLELKAASDFGKPLAGRRHSIEPGIESAPDVEVARALQDGPVPMGPIIYINAEGEIATLICRCMQPQASRVMATRSYTLAPLNPGLSQFDNVDSLIEALRLPANW